MAWMVLAGRVGSAGAVKNIEDMAFLPLLVKRDNVRHVAAARLKIGVRARSGMATCGMIKRLGSGRKNLELLKGSVSAGLVHPALSCVLPSVVASPCL